MWCWVLGLCRRSYREGGGEEKDCHRGGEGGRGAQGRFVREGDLLGHSPLPIWSANSHLLLP